MPETPEGLPRFPEGSALILFDAAGRILLQQRDDETPPAGYGRWAIPGGAREAGEDPRETARREILEETGLSLSRIRFFETATPQNTPGLRSDALHIFLADDEVDESTIVVNEGLDFRFWSPEECEALPMNPPQRVILKRFFASDKYLGALAFRAEYRVGASVLQLDRWGRVLLQLRDDDLPPERHPSVWSLPGGLVQPGESPDLAALREFEEETGHRLDDLKLFRVYRRDVDVPDSLVNVQHVYYIDADLDLDDLQVNEGQALGYVAPSEVADLPMPPHARRILTDFFEGSAYRALFH
jgi:8-oxo-dGTP pyrophosphatase MutT (NUDIX family)